MRFCVSSEKYIYIYTFLKQNKKLTIQRDFCAIEIVSTNEGHAKISENSEDKKLLELTVKRDFSAI